MYLSAMPSGVMWDGGAAFRSRYRAGPAMRTVPIGIRPGPRPMPPIIIVPRTYNPPPPTSHAGPPTGGDIPPLFNPPPSPISHAGPPTGGDVPPVFNPNAGTPVPAGFPTNQIFVNADGSFWEWSPSQSKWVNVGTPYGTGASATPPAPPPSPNGGSTAPPAAGAAPPVSITTPPAVASSGYQAILDWLEKDSLASSIGFSAPNWIVAGGAVLLGYKFLGKTGRH
jgi:hypothetical protein